MMKETRNDSGQLHSFNDEPAVECAEEYKAWYQNGRLHRVHGHAIELTNGAKYWYQNGRQHRVDGPAVELPDGYKAWFQYGNLHRLDGPAVEYTNGYKAWYQKGNPHRVDGPAVENTDGSKEYWIEGEHLTEEEFLAKTAKPSKLKLFKEIYNVYDAGETWLSQIPNEINVAFFDNPFVEAQLKISESLMKHVFTEDELVAVEWFLHEWHHNRELSICLNGEEFEFLCVDDYLSYLQSHEGWE